MRYLTSIGLLCVLQVACTYAIIQATAGGGSFVGLGALLFAVLGIPATALVNLALIRAKPTQPGYAHFTRSVLIALGLPLMQVGLLVAAAVLHW